MKEKIQSIVYVVLLLMWFVFSQLLVGTIASLTLGSAHYETFYNQHRYALNLIAQIMCLGVILGIDYKYKSFEIKKHISGLSDFLKCMGLGVLAYIICVTINLILIPYFPGYKEINEMLDGKEPIISFITIVIMAPLLEEYVFRGKMQSLMKKEFAVPVAIVTQAVLFGSLHSLGLQKIYAVTMGVIFGIVKERRDCLESTMIMHMTVNLMGWLVGMYGANF